MDITPQEFANQYLGNYKIKGSEINTKHCPFCGPNTKRDNQYKFFLNADEGTYKCHREKHCGVSGSFTELKEHFGVDDYEKPKFEKPKVKTENPGGKVIEYLKLRGFSEETIKKHAVKAQNGNIAFEYYQNGELVLVKYRTASKNKKYWQEGGGKPVLWEIDKIDTDKPVIITEGEMDKLALHEAGEENVVSVPFGSNNLKWIDECWETLEKVDQFIIWADNDEAGKKMKNEIVKRLGRHRCFIANSELKDANLVLFKKGAEGIQEVLNNAEAIPVARLVDLKDIEEFDPTQIEAVKSNIPLINKYLGGYMMGAVTIWTGSNGSGKSTFINQEVLNAVEYGFGTVLLTGELPNWLIRYWLELQAAGPKHIEPQYDRLRDEQTYRVPKKPKAKIREWCSNNNLKIYDSFESLDVEDIKETFTGAVQQLGIKNFVVDNLMIVNYNASQREKYNKQAQFVAAMKEFAKKYDVHVHVVAHPRKPKGAVITKEDIAGLYEITNLVDNVIGIHRVTDRNRDALGLKNDYETENVLDIFKGRIYGMQDLRIKLGFNEDCKRFAQRDVNDFRRQYGWEEY